VSFVRYLPDEHVDHTLPDWHDSPTFSFVAFYLAAISLPHRLRLHGAPVLWIFVKITKSRCLHGVCRSRGLHRCRRETALPEAGRGLST